MCESKNRTALSPDGAGAALSPVRRGWGPVALKEMTPRARNRRLFLKNVGGAAAGAVLWGAGRVADGHDWILRPYQSPEKKNHFLRHEMWTSLSALEAHKKMPHLRASFEKRQREGWTTEITVWKRIREPL